MWQSRKQHVYLLVASFVVVANLYYHFLMYEGSEFKACREYPETPKHENDELEAIVRDALDSLVRVETGYPKCSLACGDSEPVHLYMPERSLTMIQTRIDGITNQFNLFVRPRTVDRVASLELLDHNINHPSSTKALVELIPLLTQGSKIRPLMFDIGANLGYMSLLGSSLGAEVISLEPTFYHGSMLRASLAFNPKLARHVTWVRSAIAEEVNVDGENACLSVVDVSNAGATNVVSGLKCSEDLQARMTTMDYLVKEYGFPDIVKIDVEGYEMNALRGTFGFVDLMFPEEPLRITRKEWEEFLTTPRYYLDEKKEQPYWNTDLLVVNCDFVRDKHLVRYLEQCALTNS